MSMSMKDNYVVLKDWRLFTKKIMLIGERAVDIEESILNDVCELYDLWGFWDDGELVRDSGPLRSDKFCIQVIRVFKWDLRKRKQRFDLMKRRMEWKYPGYSEYCEKVFVTLVNGLLERQNGGAK